jgi:hypothetical protein
MMVRSLYKVIISMALSCNIHLYIGISVASELLSVLGLRDIRDYSSSSTARQLPMYFVHCTVEDI